MTVTRSTSSLWRGLFCLIILVAASSPPGLQGAPDDPEARLRTVRATLQDGFHDLAITAIQTFLAEKPLPRHREAAEQLLWQALYGAERYAELLEKVGPTRRGEGASPARTYWRGAALYGLKRYKEAENELAGLAEPAGDPGLHARAIRLWTWTNLMLGRRTETLTGFARYQALYPQEGDAGRNLLEWARYLLEDGDTPGAQRLLELLVGSHPDSPVVREGRLLLGELLTSAASHGDAVVMLLPLATNSAAQASMQARGYLELARAYRGLTNISAAIVSLEKGCEVVETPDIQNELEMDLGLLLLEGGELTNAVRVLKTVIARAPLWERSETAQRQLAAVLLETHSYDAAEVEYQHYLETYTNRSGRAEAQRGKGWALQGLERHAEAASAFQAAYELFETDADRARARFKVGDAYLANGQYQLAATSYEAFMGEFADSPLVPQALLQLGESLALAGLTVEAEARFNEVIDAYPDHPMAEEALYRRASTRLGEGRWLAAIEDYDLLIAGHTNGTHLAKAMHSRALASYRLFRLDEALSMFDRVIERFPDSDIAEESTFRRALCLYGLNRDDESLAMCRDFLEKYPESPWRPEVAFWVAKHCYNMEKHAEAKTAFLELADEGAEGSYAEPSLLWAARSAARQEDYRQAVDLVNRLVTAYPNSTLIDQARFVQGDALSKLGEFSPAILAFEDIVTEHPESDLVSAAWGRKGDCQFTLGTDDSDRYEESIASYRVAANSAGDDVALRMQADHKIGRSLEKLGRTMEAFEHYYLKVILKYLEDQRAGVWLSESARTWFTLAAFNAASIMEQREEWRRAVSILERVVKADVPAAAEAGERIARIRKDQWILF